MKRSKVFMATGGFALAIAAVFATKANKFGNIGTAAIHGAATYTFEVGSNSVLTTTNTSHRVAVRFYTTVTAGGTTIAQGLLTTVAAGGHSVYYK